MREKSGVALWSDKGFFLHLLTIVIITTLCLLNIQKVNYITVLNDEFGYWANAAVIAGYDWKDLIVETPYYAPGYSLCLIPIIALFPTPEVWYKAAIFLNIFFLICSYFLCYSTGKELFPHINKKIICLVSLIVIIYPSNIVYAQVAWSETLQYMLVWGLTFCMVRLEKKFSYWTLTIFLGLLFYLLLVHLRNIGILIAGFVCLMLVLIKNKISKRYWVIIPILLILVYLGVNQIQNQVIDTMWNSSTASNLNNVSLDNSTIERYFLRIVEKAVPFLESLEGKLFYLILGTGLTLFVAIFKIVRELISNIKNKDLWGNYSICKLWSLLIIVIMWGLTSLQMYDWQNRKDILVYSRYMEQVLGPVLLIGLVTLLSTIWEVRIGLIISYGVILCSILSIEDRIGRAASFFNSICSPIMGAFYDNNDSDKVFLVISLFLKTLFMTLLINSLIKNHKIKGSVIILTFLISYIYVGYQANTYMNDARKYFESQCLPIRNTIKDIDIDIEEIYYIKTQSDKYSVNPKYLQFMIPDYGIHVIDWGELDKVMDLYVVFLTNPEDQKSNSYLEGNGYILADQTGLLKLYMK